MLSIRVSLNTFSSLMCIRFTGHYYLPRTDLFGSGCPFPILSFSLKLRQLQVGSCCRLLAYIMPLPLMIDPHHVN